MLMNVIENIIKRSVDSFERSLSEYWPVVNPDKNGLQEINLTIFLLKD